ncbi:MAG: hypothetical protein LQ342_003988 [Letrouitia transgressa]|nr:MAG: hypothetical protein LQ342_003988 [Letrouitia transgressa]
MVVLRTSLIYLSLFISLIFAVTDFTQPENQTPALQVLWKETQKRCVTMELNKAYAFRQKDTDKISSHARLVVGHIWKDDVDDDSVPWDFEAYWFDMVFRQTRPFDHIWGGQCLTRNSNWECRDGNKFKFSGEVQIQQFEDIDDVVDAVADQGKSDPVSSVIRFASSQNYVRLADRVMYVAQAIITKNDCYSLLTNNCQLFARNLGKKITKVPPQAPPPQPPIQPPIDMRPRFEID